MSFELALKAILDGGFGLTNGESSDKDGKDIYGYVGEPVLRCSDMRSSMIRLWVVPLSTARKTPTIYKTEVNRTIKLSFSN